MRLIISAVVFVLMCSVGNAQSRFEFSSRGPNSDESDRPNIRHYCEVKGYKIERTKTGYNIDFTLARKPVPPDELLTFSETKEGLLTDLRILFHSYKDGSMLAGDPIRWRGIVAMPEIPVTEVTVAPVAVGAGEKRKRVWTIKSTAPIGLGMDLNRCYQAIARHNSMALPAEYDWFVINPFSAERSEDTENKVWTYRIFEHRRYDKPAKKN